MDRGDGERTLWRRRRAGGRSGLSPHEGALLGDLAEVDRREVRWHLEQMLPRLTLDASKSRRAVAIVESFLNDKSTIVRVNALQAPVELANDDAHLKEKARRHLTDALESGAPSEKARARKLLRFIDKRDVKGR